MDIVLAALTVTQERQQVIDMTEPYYYDDSVVIFKKPESPKKYLIFLKPFKTKVWVFLLVAVLLAPALLYVFSCMVITPGKQRHLKYHDYMWFVLGTCLCQGIEFC